MKTKITIQKDAPAAPMIQEIISKMAENQQAFRTLVESGIVAPQPKPKAGPVARPV